MSPIIDFGKTDQESKKIKNGWYDVRIVSVEQRQSKRDTPYLNWKFEVQDERKQWIYLSTGVTGKGFEVIQSIVRSCFDAEFDGGTLDTDELINALLRAHVEWQDEDSGYPTIVGFEPLKDSSDVQF